jgi:mitochondrial fission protein ELM1
VAVRDACWVVTDGAAGNENQALALAAALGFAPRVLRATLRGPWRLLAPDGPRDFRTAIDASLRAQFAPPWPDLVIGCGRAAALVTRALRRQSAGGTCAVQILDPRRHRDDFDALIVPAHDGLAGANVITCVGALNAIDDAWLERARAAFPALGDLPRPRTAILVGGPVRGFPLDRGYLDGMLSCLQDRHAREGGSFLVTCSRRTPPSVAAMLAAFFATYPGLFRRHDDPPPNPYAGLIGWADGIVVTPDSANLLSEACATGVPALAYRPASVPGKLGLLAADLIREGRLHPLEGNATATRSQPLRELGKVADAVQQLLQARKEPNGIS